MVFLRALSLLFILGWHLQVLAFDASNLERLLETRKPKTAIELMNALPGYHKAGFALIHDSEQERQRATLEEPRIITFGGGELLLAFQSHLAPHPNMIEVQDIRTTRPTFQSIEYDPALGRLKLDKGEGCKSCHGQRLHPIWQSYPVWKGAYGSIDHDEDRSWMERERRDFAGFLKGNGKHGIYKALGLSEALTLHRMTDNNGKLSEILQGWNAKRIAEDLIEVAGAHPDLAAAIDIAISDSGGDYPDFGESDFISLLPRTLDPRKVRTLYQSKYQGTNNAIVANFQMREEGIAKYLGRRPPVGATNFDEHNAAQVAALRVLVEDIHGRSTLDWGLAKERGTYNFTAPTGNFMFEVSHHYRTWMEHESPLKKTVAEIHQRTNQDFWVDPRQLKVLVRAGEKLAKQLGCETRLVGKSRWRWAN